VNSPRCNLGLHGRNIKYLYLTQSGNALHEKNQHHFTPYYYGHPDKVRHDLEELYFGKCAYCETKVTGAVLRVDHYRPKNRIKEEQTHTGYYWLGYEWSNLFPACEKCNLAKHCSIGGQQKHVTHPTLLYWGRQQKHVTHPTLIYWGRQQKHVTHPTFIKLSSL